MALPRSTPDQAEGLRRLFVPDVRRMVALVFDGEAGADLAARVAVDLAAHGSRVLLLEDALVAGSPHPVLDSAPAHDLDGVLRGTIEIEQAIVATGCGVHLLAGGSRFRPHSRGGMEACIGLINAFYRLAGRYDMVLVNTPDGALQDRPGFAWACQDVIVVQCGSVADAATRAYATIKRLHQSGERRFHLAYTGMDEAAANIAFSRLATVSRRHLQVMPDHLGTCSAPEGMVASHFPARLAAHMQSWPLPEHQAGHFPALMRRLLRGNAARAAVPH